MWKKMSLIGESEINVIFNKIFALATDTPEKDKIRYIFCELFN